MEFAAEVGYLRRDLRGLTWEDYHYACKGYLKRCAREEANFRALATVWGGSKVMRYWKIPLIDGTANELPDLTERDIEIARRFHKINQKKKG